MEQDGTRVITRHRQVFAKQWFKEGDHDKVTYPYMDGRIAEVTNCMLCHHPISQHGAMDDQIKQGVCPSDWILSIGLPEQPKYYAITDMLFKELFQQ